MKQMVQIRKNEMKKSFCVLMHLYWVIENNIASAEHNIDRFEREMFRSCDDVDEEEVSG
jgi:hypothetical protein